MALPYAVQAATGNPGLAFLPVAHYLTHHQGFAAAQLAGFQAMVLLPWMIKPLWAFDTAFAHGVYLLRGACAIVSFLGLFGRVVAICPPQVAGSAYALVVSASNLAASLGAVIGGTLYDLGLPFQGVALVGAGYTLLVGLWLRSRNLT